MTAPSPPTEWPALLAELRKLTALIGPLQALLAQEEAPGLSERIDLFLAEITRVGDQVERAATAMEAEGQSRDLMQQITKNLAVQKHQIDKLQGRMAQILGVLGAPLDGSD